MAKGKYENWLTEEGLVMLEGWARRGLTDKEIAHNVGVSERTFTDWKSRFPAISSVLKQGKEVTDLLVEGSLFKRAMGYEYEEVCTEIEYLPDKISKGGKVIKQQKKHIKKTKKFVPPDVTAQIFWLKNRRPDLWRDKVQYEADIQDDVLQKVLDRWDSDDV